MDGIILSCTINTCILMCLIAYYVYGIHKHLLEIEMMIDKNNKKEV